MAIVARHKSGAQGTVRTIDPVGVQIDLPEGEWVQDCIKCPDGHKCFSPWYYKGDCSVWVELPAMDTAQEAVLREVENERARQDERWGEQNHDPARYLAILGEEYGEACKEAVDAEAAGEDFVSEHHIRRLREELVQVAAVAVAMVECLDRDRWRDPFGVEAERAAVFAATKAIRDACAGDVPEWLETALSNLEEG